MRRKGVTIIELMIVIIVASLFGVVIAGGTQLIRAAKIRSIITKITLYEESILAFKSAYGHLPGDFPRTNIWLDEQIRDNCGVLLGDEMNPEYKTGDQASQDLNASIIAGDADGYVMAWKPSGEDLLWDSEKTMCHLILADLMPNQYKNFATISSFDYDKKTDVTSCKTTIGNSYYCSGFPINDFDGLVLIGDNGNLTIHDNDHHLLGNVIYLKDLHGRPSAHLDDNTIPLHYLVSIDNKIDDGMPGDGKIVLGSYHTKFCDNVVNSFCAPGASFDQNVKQYKDKAVLAYRPKWLNSEW